MLKRLFTLATFLLLFTYSQHALAQSKSLFFVYLNTNPDKEVLSEVATKALQAGHLDNIDNLHQQGKLVAAGPFEGGGGLFILKAESLEQAHLFLATDPAIKANRFIIEVYPFQFWNGGICETSEPYEMVTYQFCRLRSNPEGDFGDLQFNNRIFFANQYNQTEDVLCYAFYEDSTDGFALFNVAETSDVETIVKEHPSIKAGLIEFEIKPLWIAKGTFCE